MNKKGISWKFIIAVILALSLVLVFLLFQSELFAQYTQKAVEDRCEATVFREYLIKHSSGKDFADSVECRQISREIKSSDGDEIAYDLLKDAYTCWDMFGGSELDLFKDYGSFCHLCYVENFKRDVRVEGLLRKAKETVVPGEDFSYWGGMNLFIQPELRQSFRTDKPLAVVFSFIRVGSESDYTELLEAAGKWGVGTLYSKVGQAAGVFVKHNESESADKLRQVFDYLGFAPPVFGKNGPPGGYFYVGVVEYTPENLNNFACEWTPRQKE